MTDSRCSRPVLIVEGAGDKEAIPLLIRRTLADHGIYDVHSAPRPKTNFEIRKLRRAGELERYVEYACRDDGDGVLIALDCEDFCPVEVAREFCVRIRQLNVKKRVATVLFRSEYESMFLCSLDEIRARYPEFGWKEAAHVLPADVEDIRNAKGLLSSLMRYDRAYKETRDQVRFSQAVSLDKLRARSRSYRHFEAAMLWLVGSPIVYDNVYPAVC